MVWNVRIKDFWYTKYKFIMPIIMLAIRNVTSRKTQFRVRLCSTYKIPDLHLLSNLVDE